MPSFLSGQTFEPIDLVGVITLVVLEALLSADNAIVLAVLVKHLTKKEQRRALTYGLVGAFLFRLVAVVFAASVLKIWAIQALGAAYLIFIAAKHLLTESSEGEVKAKVRSFWMTVFVVELTDIAFAIDSILAGVSFIGKRHDKLWVVYFGAIIGIVLLRIAATKLVALLEKYPKLDSVAYSLVAWVGAKLAMLAIHHAGIETGRFSSPEMPTWLFWSGMGLIGLWGWFVSYRDRNPASLEELQRRAAEQLDSPVYDNDWDDSEQTADASDEKGTVSVNSASNGEPRGRRSDGHGSKG